MSLNIQEEDEEKKMMEDDMRTVILRALEYVPQTGAYDMRIGLR